jgi:hypothetical protein
MGRVVLAMTLCAVGCTDGEAPPFVDASASVDGPLDGNPVDPDAGPLGPDGSTPAGCKTACDCPAGERCRAGVCEVTVPMVFCCGAATCTGDNFCQQSDGKVSQCSLPPDAGVTLDGGAAGCGMDACTKGAAGDIFCEIACAKTTARCVSSGGGSAAHCMP